MKLSCGRFSSLRTTTATTVGVALLLLTLTTFTTTTTTTQLPFFVDAAGSSSSDKCATEENQLQCPNTEACPSSGYSYVSDCNYCDNNLNTDIGSQQCFTRKILNGKDNPSSKYLWLDIVGMIVWFCAAGVATSCGVGGGGIYVPLGILLLSFAPKQSSGLSQASIFGASLGGLVLNLRNFHPFTAKIETIAGGGGGDTEDPSGGGDGSGENVTANIPTNDNGEPNTSTTKYYTRPLIDYDMALFLAPMEMAGAVLGVLIQKILPNWLYLFISAVILGFTAKKTYVKWWSTRQKELQKAAEELLQTNSEEQENLTTVVDGDNGDSGEPSIVKPSFTKSSTVGTDDKSSSIKDEIEITEMMRTSDASGLNNIDNSTSSVGIHHRHGLDVKPEAATTSTDEPSDDNVAADNASDDNDDDDNIIMDKEKIAKRNYFLERDSRQYPKEKLICFAILWLGLTLLTFIKGGKGVPSLVGINCSSPWYAVLIGIQFLWTFGFAAGFAYKITKETSEKRAVKYPFHSQDVLWDFHKTRFYAFFTFCAGVIAGLIGIGGGMVLGPLMLVMGIYPRVSTATTATMIVLTSSSVAILYVTSGLVPWQYAITFFSTCFVGAITGKTVIDGYVKRTGKSSILIFMLATIIALATCGALVIALLRLNSADWCFAGFEKFCSIDDGSASVSCVPDEEAQRYLMNGAIDFYKHVIVAGTV